MLLYIIQLQTFLLQLEDALPGVTRNYPDFEKRVEACVDDVVYVMTWILYKQKSHWSIDICDATLKNVTCSTPTA
jgi:hypothetical protein